MASNLAGPEGAILCIKHLKALNNINCVAERIINCHEAVSFVGVAGANSDTAKHESDSSMRGD